MKAYPNILLIAGSGQNSGKTLLACRIIRCLSHSHEVVAIKTSSHRHTIDPRQKIIKQTKNYLIVEENLLTNKDSSRMLRAGAHKSYYIQGNDEGMKDALKFLEPVWKNKATVCESGSLHKCIRPGLFLFVQGGIIPENKTGILDFNPNVIQSQNGVADFDISGIKFEDRQLYHPLISFV